MSEVLIAGAEFSVNTNTAFNQTAPEIAALPDGGYVIVWGTADASQDGNSSAIKAQRFDASGNPVGPEFLVNSQSFDAQFTPDVAAFPDGSFIICWVSNDANQDGSSSAVKAQLFDADGSPVGFEFLVNTQAMSRQDDPRVTVLDNGNFVVSWTDWSGFDMKAQIFSPEGQKIGGEFLVNTSTSASQEFGDVVALEGGGFAVTWRTTDAAADGSGYAVMGRVFDSSGVGATEFVVNSAKAGNQYSSSIAALAGGGFVVVWHTGDSSQDGSGGAVKGQLFDASGAAVGNEFLANSEAANFQDQPVVTALPSGGFVVVWKTSDTLQDGSGGALKGQYFDASGQAIGNEFLVNSLTSGAQSLASLTTLDDGTVLVTWASDSGDGSGVAVRGRTFDMAFGPEIVSNGGGAIAAVSIDENQTGVTQVVASDADSPALAYSITGGADAALFTIDPDTGVLSFISAPDFEAPAGDGDNQYEVVVTATDGAFSDTQTLTVTVNNLVEVITGTAGNDTLTGTGGNDEINGLAGNDSIAGSSGNDTLDGGTGADTLIGGTGDDIYIVDSGSDVVTENAGEGTDTVRSGVTHTLRDNVENLVLTGSNNSSGFGNALANVLTGNSGYNRLYGLDGNDTLIGGEGGDTLDGGSGSDAMTGGTGDDSYYVDSTGDTVTELAGEGTDTVNSTLGYTLGANVENLVLTGTGHIDGIGNGLANRLTGNGGNNWLQGGDGNDWLVGYGGGDILDGGAGADTMYGGIGSDTYIIDAVGDQVIEKAGEGWLDIVHSYVTTTIPLNVEILSLVGSADLTAFGNQYGNELSGNDGANGLYGRAGGDTLKGNAGDDLVKGEDGDDILWGGSGRDDLYGGGGADSFSFTTGDFAGLTDATCDRIYDFSQAEADKISFNQMDANDMEFGDQAFSFIGDAAFGGIAGQLRSYQDGGNTYVQGDTNGDGVADFLIRLDGLHSLTSGDFIL